MDLIGLWLLSNSLVNLRCVCCHGDCRLLSRMAGMKDQQFTEEKPLLPESRGQEPEMVSKCVCVRIAKYSRPVKNVPLFLGKCSKTGCVCT